MSKKQLKDDNSLDKNENQKENVVDPSAQLLLEKKAKRKKVIISIIVVIAASAFLFGFGLLWQWRVDLLAICNAFYLGALLMFSFGFMVFAINNNVFSPLVYGVKSFFLMFAGKRPKLSYYDYTQSIKENQLPKYLMRVPMYGSLLNLTIAIILHIVFKSI